MHVLYFTRILYNWLLSFNWTTVVVIVFLSQTLTVHCSPKFLSQFWNVVIFSNKNLNTISLRKHEVIISHYFVLNFKAVNSSHYIVIYKRPVFIFCLKLFSITYRLLCDINRFIRLLVSRLFLEIYHTPNFVKNHIVPLSELWILKWK